MTASWNDLYLSVAAELAKGSKDPKRQVGAVIVRDHDILSCGINGFAPGSALDTVIDWENRELVRLLIHHAEWNAISRAVAKKVDLKGATLYCTLEPCEHCRKLIDTVGISRVVFKEKYEWLKFMEKQPTELV